ncbi:MAG: DsbA family oxidoreductase [Actinomycetes bacterium]
MIIDVWSDVVCPWCFIGRRRLQKAIASLPTGSEVTVRHRAFQLNPAADAIVPTAKLLADKYRLDKTQVDEMQANVCSVADGEGLCYNLNDTLSGNTGDAHRLLLWSDTVGKQDELLEAMYSTYFEKSGALFTDEDLVTVASSIGLNSDEVRRALESVEFTSVIEQDQALAQQLGANGVPFFVVDMKYGISGAQPQEVFDQTLLTALNA